MDLSARVIFSSITTKTDSTKSLPHSPERSELHADMPTRGLGDDPSPRAVYLDWVLRTTTYTQVCSTLPLTHFLTDLVWLNQQFLRSTPVIVRFAPYRLLQKHSHQLNLLQRYCLIPSIRPCHGQCYNDVVPISVRSAFSPRCTVLPEPGKRSKV